MEPWQGPDWCEGREVCVEADRWYCASLTDWRREDDSQPWDDLTDTGLLRYLATMSLDEQRELADIAAGNLDCGAWQGCKTPNGGWEDGEPWCDGERQWRPTARDFLDRYQRGDRTLTEGMIQYARYDLARELAWVRGWCPQAIARL